MYTIQRSAGGGNWWCLYRGTTMLETFDRKWQARDAMLDYQRAEHATNRMLKRGY